MTQEEKDLLFKDLCARLPYGTKYAVDGFNPDKFKNGKLDVNAWDVISLNIDTESYYYELCHVKHTCPNETIYHNYVHFSRFKPYLFPLSSMTKKQREELYKIGWYLDEDKIYSCFRNYDDENYKTHTDCFELINWCYKNNFDINGLIPKGLAIDATDKNIY